MAIDFRAVIERFPRSCQPQHVEFLGSAGGFSGATFWRLTTPRGPLCLRRWPAEHPDGHQLEQIHDVLQHVFRAGFPAVPVPIRTLDGATYVPHDGRFWELAAWLPGEASYHQQPGRERLAAAAESLARFHRAAATYGSQRTAAPSPGLQRRYEQLIELRSGGKNRIRQAVLSCGWPGLRSRATALLDLFDLRADETAAALNRARQLAVTLQPCICDIWHDHVLFDGNQVSGLIDFGAMRVETVAGDVARLIGSLVADDADAWRFALGAYSAVSPLSDTLQALIPVFDRSSVLLAGMNWLTWICVEQRRFDEPDKVLERLDVTIERLRHLSGGRRALTDRDGQP